MRVPWHPLQRCPLQTSLVSPFCTDTYSHHHSCRHTVMYSNSITTLPTDWAADLSSLALLS
eukprot:m.38514 g.38514  ORF g.38514 m.38514 type:complete len:61 (+) comp45297_c0_seq1:370-552(+)